MWNMKAKVIPVIKGATGTISKSLRQYLSNIPGKQEINNKKQPHWGLHTYIMESANVKVQTYFTGEITLHVAQTVNAEQLQHYTYTLETWVV
jgi:hypothetical protein